jgi:hypothetical protein
MNPFGKILNDVPGVEVRKMLPQRKPDDVSQLVLLATTEQYRALIERAPRGSQFSIHFWGNSGFTGTSDVFASGIRATVWLTRQKMLGLANDLLLKDREADGRRIILNIHHYPADYTAAKPLFFYWM